MALQLDEDERVLQAALALLDDVEAAEADASSTAVGAQTSGRKRKQRSSNPNRAREARYKELLALRELVPKLQKRLQQLEEEAREARATALTNSNESTQLWKKLALLQRQTRANAEEENRRLRELLQEQAVASTLSVQRLLQTEQRPRMQPMHRGPPPWTSKRMYAMPLEHCDGAVFKELADSIDTVYHQALRVVSPGSTSGQTAAPCGFAAENVHRPSFADRILPFGLDDTGAAAWQYFAHSFRRPTTRFYYHADTPQVIRRSLTASIRALIVSSLQSTGLVSDDTVVESFGEMNHFGHVALDVRVKQIVRLYKSADCVVVVWRGLIRPEQFKGETLHDIVFEEKGALVIEPLDSCSESDHASIVHTWQVITPDLYDSATEPQAPLIQELTDLVVTGCRPGRAIESVERMLHFRSVPSELLVP